MLELKFRDNWSLVFLFANSDLGASPNTDKDKQFWLKLVNLTFTYDSTLFPNINASYGMVKSTNVIFRECFVHSSNFYKFMRGGTPE